MKNLLFSLLMCLSLPANAAFINSINITPDPALSTSEILANVAGDLADPSFFISSTSLNLSGNIFTYDIFSDTSGGISPQILVPFEVSENLGIVSPGNYIFIANGYIGDRLTSTLSTSFAVSAVPLPASICFFLSGIVVLLRSGKPKSIF